MCTDSKMSKDSAIQWTEALCQLHGVPWPVKVKVCTEIPSKLGSIETRRIQIYDRDLKMLEEIFAVPFSVKKVKEIIVPKSCIIQAVIHEECPEDPSNKRAQDYILRDYYRNISLANVDIADVVVWSPTPSGYTQSELISCVLYFVGQEITEPHSIFAFVCPQKGVAESTILNAYLKSDRILGWGKVYRVPLSDVYRWEDINQARRQVTSELSNVKLEYRQCTVDGKRLFEFFYNCSLSQPHHKPLTKETLKDVTQDELGKLGENVVGGLVRADDSKMKLHYSPESGHDDRNQIPDGKVAEAKQHFLGEDGKRKRCSSASRSRSTSVDEELNKIILFGKCIVSQETPNKVVVSEIKAGDIVVANLEAEDGNSDNIIGKVVITCEIPSFKAKQVFVGLAFEEKVNLSPFEVRHVWGKENDSCYEHCKGGKNVFIPLECLLNTNHHTQNHLRVIKESTNSNQTKNPTPASEIQVDFKYEASRRDFVLTPIDSDSLTRKLKNTGIEGNANSCYIDAVLFALYAFTTNFDEGLLKHVRSTKHSGEMSVQIEAARNVLKYDIVSPLRSLLKVNWEHVYKLRITLANILNDESYLGNFMDAETFIVSLFSEVLQVPEFFELGEDTKDYILQLFPPMVDEPEGRPMVDRSSVQYLLEEYCAMADVKLQNVPKAGFIIKLPVSSGVHHFKYVYPNLKLELSKLLEKNEKTGSFMSLRAVICLKTNHFTCFVRDTPRNSGEKPAWFFHDSMASEPGSSILTECPKLETALEIVAPVFENPSVKSSTIPDEAKGSLDFLLTTAYTCVYEPVAYETQL